MAGARDIRAGRAFVELVAKKDQFSAGLKQVSTQLRSFAEMAKAIGGSSGVSDFMAKFTSVGTVGGAVTGAFTAIVKSFSNTSDELARMSERTGVRSRARIIARNRSSFTWTDYIIPFAVKSAWS